MLALPSFQLCCAPLDIQHQWVPSHVPVEHHMRTPHAHTRRMFPDTSQRPLSSAWEAMLKSDCPDCPWWPETRKAATALGSDPLNTLYGPDYVTPSINSSNLNVFIDASVKPVRGCGRHALRLAVRIKGVQVLCVLYLHIEHLVYTL